MTDNVVPFKRASEDGLTVDQWHDGLIDLHERLTAALAKDRKQIDCIRLVLSIDDVMDLCQAIEETVGPDRFTGPDVD